jgi:large subunit ribosomal protein L10
MVSEKKKRMLKEVKEDLKKYKVIGIIDMFKLPAKQLYDIRNKLREDAVIKMVKKRIIKLAFKDCGLKGIEELDKHIQGEPALLLSNTDPFKMAKTINASKSRAFAKTGDISPMQIVVKAGPTPLPPGPVIGELQRVKIPASVEGEKISVVEDTVVAEEGDVISKGLADIMAKLLIEPMEIGLNLIAAWENGYVYTKDILFVSIEKYMEDIKTASLHAFNLAYNAGYYTKDNIPLFLSKAHQQAFAIAVEADILTKETIKPLISKANAQAEALMGMMKDVPEPTKEETKKDNAEDANEEKSGKEEGSEKKKDGAEEKKNEPDKKEADGKGTEENKKHDHQKESK